MLRRFARGVERVRNPEAIIGAQAYQTNTSKVNLVMECGQVGHSNFVVPNTSGYIFEAARDMKKEKWTFVGDAIVY
jgi:hypothetical protein